MGRPAAARARFVDSDARRTRRGARRQARRSRSRNALRSRARPTRAAFHRADVRGGDFGCDGVVRCQSRDARPRLRHRRVRQRTELVRRVDPSDRFRAARAASGDTCVSAAEERRAGARAGIAMMILAGIALLLLAVLGAPLFALIAAIALLGFHAAGQEGVAVAVEFYRIADMPALIAIPLFTLAGYLLAESRAPQRLVRVSNALLRSEEHTSE